MIGIAEEGGVLGTFVEGFRIPKITHEDGPSKINWCAAQGGRWALFSLSHGHRILKKNLVTIHVTSDVIESFCVFVFRTAFGRFWSQTTSGDGRSLYFLQEHGDAHADYNVWTSPNGLDKLKRIRDSSIRNNVWTD